MFAAKKRLKEMSKEGDSKLAKKARKLADDIASSGQKNSILKHVQAGIPSAPRGPMRDSAREKIIKLFLPIFPFKVIYFI